MFLYLILRSRTDYVNALIIWFLVVILVQLNVGALAKIPFNNRIPFLLNIIIVRWSFTALFVVYIKLFKNIYFVWLLSTVLLILNLLEHHLHLWKLLFLSLICLLVICMNISCILHKLIFRHHVHTIQCIFINEFGWVNASVFGRFKKW